MITVVIRPRTTFEYSRLPLSRASLICENKLFVLTPWTPNLSGAWLCEPPWQNSPHPTTGLSKFLHCAFITLYVTTLWSQPIHRNRPYPPTRQNSAASSNCIFRIWLLVWLHAIMFLLVLYTTWRLSQVAQIWYHNQFNNLRKMDSATMNKSYDINTVNW